MGCGRKFIDMVCASQEVTAVVRTAILAALLYPVAERITLTGGRFYPYEKDLYIFTALLVLGEVCCRFSVLAVAWALSPKQLRVSNGPAARSARGGLAGFPIGQGCL
jgi:hypothetical protein